MKSADGARRRCRAGHGRNRRQASYTLNFRQPLQSRWNLEVQTGWIPQEQLGNLVVERLWPPRRNLFSYGTRIASRTPTRRFSGDGISPTLRPSSTATSVDAALVGCSKAHSESAKHATTPSRPTACSAIPCFDSASIICRPKNSGPSRKISSSPPVSRRRCLPRQIGPSTVGRHVSIISPRTSSAGIIATSSKMMTAFYFYSAMFPVRAWRLPC